MARSGGSLFRDLIAARVLRQVYRLPWLVGALRGAMNAFVPNRLTEVRVASGPLRGARLEVNLRAGKYWWLGTYEPWVQEAIMAVLRPGSHAWDVGAYFGYHTLLMRRVAGAHRVIALEPDPSNRAHLERHLALNDATDVTVLPVAAGAAPGRGRVEVYRVPSGNEVVPVNDGAGELEIVTLDGLLDRYPPPSLIKVDVEGAEDAVLAGARRVLEDVRPTWIIELHSTDATPLARLQRAGYTVEVGGRRASDAVRALPGGPVHLVAHP
jgi:FkbM family methyltransferase